jgi:hypothetical protein
MRFENLTVAINVTVRQGHLVFTTLGGYNIVYLVHLTAGSVAALPLRFADQVHKSNLMTPSGAAPEITATSWHQVCRIVYVFICLLCCLLAVLCSLALAR